MSDDEFRRVTPPRRASPKMPSQREELVSRLTGHYSNSSLRNSPKLLRGRARAGERYDIADWEAIGRMVTEESNINEFARRAKDIQAKVDDYRSTTPDQNRKDITNYESQRIKDQVSLPVPESGITNRTEFYEAHPRDFIPPKRSSSYLLPIEKPRPRTIGGLGALAGGMLVNELTKRFDK